MIWNREEKVKLQIKRIGVDKNLKLLLIVIYKPDESGKFANVYYG